MLVISDNHIHIDHVMWQPTGWCTRKCPGCYVKRHQESAERVGYYNHWPQSVGADLYRILALEELTCDQLTVSLDMVDPDQLRSTSPWSGTSQSLKDTLRSIWKLASIKKDWLCVTVEEESVLSFYQFMLGFSMEEFVGPLSMVTFSHLRDSESNWKKLLKANGTSINRNIRKPEKRIDKSIDQYYIVLTKPELGEPVDKTSLEDFLSTLNSLNKQKELKGKVFPDVCMRDAVVYAKEGLHCGAGINKIMIWPYGGVTGCPYDSKISSHPKAKLIDGIREVVEGKKCSMERCKISQALKDHSCQNQKLMSSKPSK